jgi:hypothetical protein
MNRMKSGVLLRIALSGLLLLARDGMAEEALGEGTLGMACRKIESLETETGGKLLKDLSRSPDGRVVGYHSERTRHGIQADIFYSCLTAKSVVVSMSVYMNTAFLSGQDGAQVIEMEIESAKRAGYKVCREFEERAPEKRPPGEDYLDLIHFLKHTVVLRNGSREYVVEWITVGNGPRLGVHVGPKAYMPAHCK